MRVIVGVVGLLVAAAVVMVVAKQQLQAAGTIRAPATAAAPAAAPEAAPAEPPTVADRATQIQHRVREDVSKALQQGAAQRAEDR
jgi:hypothetical protein